MCGACRKEFCSTECQFLECDGGGETACLACAKAAASYFRSKCQEQKKEMEQLKEMKQLNGTQNKPAAMIN